MPLCLDGLPTKEAFLFFEKEHQKGSQIGCLEPVAAWKGFPVDITVEKVY
jgi:hypothetical protein